MAGWETCSTEDPRTREVAVFSTPAEQQEYRDRFCKEARAAGCLSHPGIVTVFDVEPTPQSGTPFIVMEYVEGKSLDKLLGENQGRLPLGPS
jgi:serine/threonine protein kinase